MTFGRNKKKKEEFKMTEPKPPQEEEIFEEEAPDMEEVEEPPRPRRTKRKVQIQRIPVFMGAKERDQMIYETLNTVTEILRILREE